MIDGENIRQRAANAYVVWPLALLDLFREPEDATAWSRIHTRQAFVFGIAATLAYLLLLAIPLLLVLTVPNVSTTVVVWVYGLGSLADIAGACFLLVLALMYRRRALRGELFEVPYVGRLSDRIFPSGRQ